ncbi:MAG: Gfo/Idh/MocA family protein, partial [Thermoguttaceae bacterium]
MHQNQWSRREFFKKSAGLAAIGLAAPYFHSSALAEEGKSKNDRLNVAIVGVGGRGTVIGRQAAHFGHIAACADVDSMAAKKFASKVRGKCETYKDYRKILDRPDIDVIICGTPDHWHTKIALDTMQAGKHLYCEKPLTLTLGESKIIAKA